MYRYPALFDKLPDKRRLADLSRPGDHLDKPPWLLFDPFCQKSFLRTFDHVAHSIFY
jgi:hypothetical protein